MKLITTLLCLFTLINSSKASDSTIIFRDIPYSSVFEVAKQENKPVLLYFHFNGCGGCINMEKNVFVDSAVANFYNKNFICFEVNTREGEGIETNKIYGIQMHPTFLFLDKTGEDVHKIVGSFSPVQFIQEAKNALEQKNTLNSYIEQYQQGNRDPKFLLDYCYRLQDAYEIDSLHIVEYINTQSKADLAQEHNIKFIYEFAIYHYDIFMPYDSEAFQFMLQNQDLFAKYFDPEQVETRIVWILSSAIYEAIENQDEKRFNMLMEKRSPYDTGKTYLFKEMDGRTTGIMTSKSLALTSLMLYYKKAGDTVKYQETLERYISKIWDDAEALNQIAWNYYEQYNDAQQISLAITWVKRSIALDSNYANHDTYAALLYKLKDYKSSLEQAEIAIDIAKEKGLNYQETTNLIRKIQQEFEK
ncbi:Thioredoxin-related protein [Lishizhenia tianjinensis]|uniref:Thioredoxin-related protein n=1 Tax=Lishizhenia tianjinensis TaxID=477690 RepID=A0A1I6XN99_9FLAO|nr:thioredoxin fold domain-containing protein [Lishizhenia tianjinensis]SFT39865.1 Thioredoxin-related protein [Lishizhenia tianjinensis]